MAICKYCGKYVAESQARQARFSGVKEYYHERCYRLSGQATRDANTEKWYQTSKTGKSVRGVLYCIFITGLMYLLIGFFFKGLSSGINLLISLACGIASGINPVLRNSKLPMIFPALVVAAHFVFPQISAHMEEKKLMKEIQKKTATVIRKNFLNGIYEGGEKSSFVIKPNGLLVLKKNGKSYDFSIPLDAKKLKTNSSEMNIAFFKGQFGGIGMAVKTDTEEPPSVFIRKSAKFDKNAAKVVVGRSYEDFELNKTVFNFGKNGKETISDKKYFVAKDMNAIFIRKENPVLLFFTTDGEALLEDEGDKYAVYIDSENSFATENHSQVEGKTYKGKWDNNIEAKITFGTDKKTIIKFSNGDNANGEYLPSKDGKVILYIHSDGEQAYLFTTDSDAESLLFYKTVYTDEAVEWNKN